MFQYNNRGYAHSLSSPSSVIDNPQDAGPSYFPISDASRSTRPPQSYIQTSSYHTRQNTSSSFPLRPAELSTVDDTCSTTFNGLEQQTVGHVERGDRYIVAKSSRRPWWAAVGSGIEELEVAERVQRLSADATPAGLDQLHNRRQPASLTRQTHQSTVTPSNHLRTDLAPSRSERPTQSEDSAAPTAVGCPAAASSAFQHLPSSFVTQRQRNSSTAPLRRPQSRNEPTVTPSASGPGGHQKVDQCQRYRTPSKSSIAPQSRYCDQVGLSPSAKPLLHSMYDDGDVADADVSSPRPLGGDHVGSPTRRRVDMSSQIAAFGENGVNDGVGVHGGVGTTPGVPAPTPAPPPPSIKHAESVVCSTIRLPPRMTTVSNDGHLSLLADTPPRRSTMSRSTPRIRTDNDDDDDCSISTDRQVTTRATRLTSSSGDVSKHPVVGGAATSRASSVTQLGAAGGHQSGTVNANTRSSSRDETSCARRSCPSSSIAAVGDSDVRGSLVTTAFLAGVSLFLGALAVQLLLRLTSMTSSHLTSPSSSIFSSSGDNEERSIRAVIGDVAVSLAVIVVAVDLCCLLSASLQCYFVIQLIRLGNGRDRQVSRRTSSCSVSFKPSQSSHLYLCALNLIMLSF